jgi:hypothetical protein
VTTICCVDVYKKHKNRVERRKAYDGETTRPGNAFCLVQAFNNSKFALQKANGGVAPSLQLKLGSITVDNTTGNIITTYVPAECASDSSPNVESGRLTKGLKKLWRTDPKHAEVAPTDVMQPVTQFLGESKVNDSPRVEVDPDQVPGCILVVGTGAENILLHGFRDGPCISMPWHGFFNSPAFARQVLEKGTIFVRCLKTGKEKECKVLEVVTHNKSFDKMNNMRGSGLDSVCLKVLADDWSCLGAQSLCGSKHSNPFMAAHGYKVVCYAQDFQTRKIYRSEGNIIPDTTIADHGLIKHTCNTEPGCSGTPLWSSVNGRLMWSGMHVGTYGAPDTNVGVSVSAYGHLRRMAGLVIKTPKVSQEMLVSLEKMVGTTDSSSLQKLLDAYLTTVKEDVDEYDGAKLAPLCPAQLCLESLGPGSLSSVITSTDSHRSFQSVLDVRDYERMASAFDDDHDDHADPPDDDERDSTDDERKFMSKSHRRAHRDEQHDQRDHQTRQELEDEIHDQMYGDRQQGPMTFQAPRPVLRGTPWADFTDESIRDLVLKANLTPDYLQVLAKKQDQKKEGGVPSSLSTISEESHATLGSDPPSPDIVVCDKSPRSDPAGFLTVTPADKGSKEAIPFTELKNSVSCQSLPSHDQRVRDDLAKIQLGFDHANYSSITSVIETEAELRAISQKKVEAANTGVDPNQLIEAGLLGRIPLSVLAHQLETSVSYSDLRDHPLFRDYWATVDTTAEKTEIDPRPLQTKSGKTAVSKDGDLMARVVAEISPSFKGGTTTQPQRLDPNFKAALERVEAEFRREAVATQDPKLIEAMLHAPVSWDWALPPTSSANIKDSLVSQLKRLRKGGFRNYPKVASTIDEHWSQVLSRYDTADVTGDLDNLTDRITDAFSALDLKKSSGWSSRVIPGTKEIWSAGSNRARIEEWVRARLMIHIVLGSRLIGRMSPYLLVKSGCKDPEEMFIKMEVHRPKKQASLRWRLIWNPSLLDTLVLYTLHVRTNKKSLEQYETGRMTHQVLGMGHHDEGIARLGEIIEGLYQTGKPVTTSDASAWDFSVRRDGFFLDAYRRIATTRSSSALEKQLYDDLLLTQAALLSAHVVAIGSELVEILHFGILSSGILSTGDINSFLRTTYAFCAGAVATMACSDDLVAAGEMDLEHLEDLGIIDPEVELVPQGMPLEFTSHKFVKNGDGKWIAIYNNVNKLFNGLILKNLKVDGTLLYPGQETASGQRFAIRHNVFASRFYEKLFEVFSWDLPEADPFSIATY